jgi:hypothetical protein
MKRTILYFFIGTILKFLLDYFIFGVEQWEIELLYAIAFGLGWGLAYFVDRPNWKLAKKMGLSFVGVVVLLVFGGIFLGVETAVQSIVKFSTIFVGYYLLASFKESKSLRE